MVAEVHEQVADLLGSPQSVRVRGDAEDVHVTGADLDHEQAVQPLERHGAVHLEEIGGEHVAAWVHRNCRHVVSVSRTGAGGIRAAFSTRRIVDALTCNPV